MSLELDTARASVVLRDTEGTTRWEVSLDAALLERACFKEAYVWKAAGVACVGAAELVRFYDLRTGAPRGELRLHDLHPSAFSLFGHFGEVTLRDGARLLLVLTYTDAIAVGASLGVRWVARDVAVDGLIFHAAAGDRITLSAEMDPPGGWVEVVLDAATGHELAREGVPVG